ncbi:multiple myeloma tumor-associated protein 2 homolog [Cucurbita pepo subsp. pepo]|uniref:multiple myeloma tumor-associated protein 2 homolog n=1 Tax=Cucurbita pepo subsp. pepo TaxID=3664 RepID=UPI000C9D513F|nr:multiple myeloma tumor-associated protein 2 homolog [Cucurbita pepo subsp. pepo]
MYHPTRGGVRGGRDQFNWDDVKVDKHRENFLGHSIKAPVGRWQKGKDLHWYARDKKSSSNVDVAKEEIRLIKEQEEQAMREALGLAPKTAGRSQGNRLDKHEFSELVKRGSTAEDLGAGHAEAARVQGLGFLRAPHAWEESKSLPPDQTGTSAGSEKTDVPDLPARNAEEEEVEDEKNSKKRRREERRGERHEERHERRGERREERREEKRERHEERREEKRERHEERREEKRESHEERREEKRERHEERREEKRERRERHEKYEKKHSQDSRKKRSSRDKERGRHDSD